MNNLKEKLLGLGMFEDNEFLDLYCSLIEQNIGNVKIKNETERHHIIPRRVFKILNLPYKASSKNSIVNKNNIIHLSYKNHLLAHYYLCFCAKNEYKKIACYTFTRMVSKINKNKRPSLDNLTEIDINNYVKARKMANLHMIECDKVRNKHIYEDDFKRLTNNSDILIDYYINKNHTLKECSIYFNTTVRNLIKTLHYLGIYKRKGWNTEIYNIITKEKLYGYYVEEAHSWEETCNYFDIGNELLKKLLHKYEISKIPGQRITNKEYVSIDKLKLTLTKDVLYNDLYNLKLSINEILIKYNFDVSNCERLRRIIKDYAYETPCRIHSKYINSINYMDFYNYYIVENHTLKQTMQFFSLSEAKTLYYIKLFNCSKSK